MKLAAARADEARGQAGAVGDQTAGAIGGGGQQAAAVPMRALPSQSAQSLAGVVQPNVEQAKTKRAQDAKVAGSEVSRALAEARSMLAKEATAESVKKIGNRVFYRTTGFWVEADCALHGEAPSREISRDSKEYADMLAREPALAELHSAGVPILLYWNGTNYLIR